MNKNENFYNYGFYVSIAIIVLDIYFSIVFAQNAGEKYYLMLIAVPFLVILILYFRAGFKKVKSLNFIKREWEKSKREKEISKPFLSFINWFLD